MRESQMKKIIAAAVATAFVAPVMAADVAISGSMIYSMSDVETTSGTTKSLQDDSSFNIVATHELPNGITVKADFDIDEDGDDGDSGLTLSGAFGSLKIGSASGAIDNIDDIGEWAYFAGGNTEVGGNAAVLYTLPSFAEGLRVFISHSPADGGTNNATHVASDVNGVGASFSVAGLTFGLAQEDVVDATNSMFNVAYSTGPLKVTYERSESDLAGGVTDDFDQTVVSASYTMGNTTFRVFNDNKEINNATDHDETGYGIHYAVGGGLTAFVEIADDAETTSSNESHVGVAFKF
jgi:hypothetical protein